MDIQFPINQALLEEAQKLKHERSMLKERIRKIEAKKNEVSPTVYQKVKHDYTSKMNEVTNTLLEKKTDIDRELSTLYETRTKVTENLEGHKEKVEELKFRSDLGEFDGGEFERLSKEESEKVGKFEKILAAVNFNIERYEAIFADEEGMADTTNPSIKRGKTKTDKIEGSDYMIATEEKDYFTPEEERRPSISQEVTKKTANAGEARVIIIEGSQAGHEYKLKKETTIGRANTSVIVLKDAKVSRQHAVIKRAGAEFVIEDLNSSNGVIVNHEKVKEHVLGDGDQIQIGDHIFQFKIF